MRKMVPQCSSFTALGSTRTTVRLKVFVLPYLPGPPGSAPRTVRKPQAPVLETGHYPLALAMHLPPSLIPTRICQLSQK